MRMNNLVKIITLVVVIAMVAAMALVSCGKEEPVDNTTNEQIEALNATIESLKAALDKAQADATAENAELEAALKDAIASLEQAGINSEKWTEATANIPVALEALEEVIKATGVEYGFAPDEDGKTADVWYVEADVEAAAEAAYAVAVDAINRAVTVDEQNAAIEAFKAALAPENFEKIDVKIKGIIAAIEADGVTYPADKKLVEEDLVAALAAVSSCCDKAQKAVADAKYADKAAELTEKFVADAVKVLTAEYKAAMDAFAAKTTTVALFEEKDGVADLRTELDKYGDIDAIEATTKIAKSLTKYEAKLVEVAALKAFYDEVTSVKDEEKGTVDGFNALMAAYLKDFDKKDLVEVAAQIAAYKAQIEAYVNDADLVDLLENEENYNIINHETLAKLEAAFAEATAAIVEKAEAFIKAVEALEELETVDLTIKTLIADAKTAWNALEADYAVAAALDLFVDEDGENIYEYTIEEYKTIYEANKAKFNAIQELVNVIENNITNANKLVFVNYQYDKKDDDGKLVDSKLYSINSVNYDDFKKAFYGETSYQNVDGQIDTYLAAINVAVDKLTKPTKAQVEAGAEGDGTGLYGLEIAEETLAKIEAIKLLEAKVEGIKAVFEAHADYNFDGANALRDEIIAEIWGATDAKFIEREVATIVDQFDAAKDAVQ